MQRTYEKKFSLRKEVLVGNLLHGGVVEDVPADVHESFAEQLRNSGKNKNVLEAKQKRPKF